MITISLKNPGFLTNFLLRYSDEKRQRVAQYLMVIGVDLVAKLGLELGSSELFQTLQQLAKNITKESTVSGSGELKGEIRKIQAQLIELNSRIENQNYQFQISKLQPKSKSNRKGSPEQPLAEVHNYPSVRHHMDDNQIKSLLYGKEDQRFISKNQSHKNQNANYKQNQKGNAQSLLTNSSRERTLPNDQPKKNVILSQKGVPTYLKKIESKIKNQVQQDKLIHQKSNKIQMQTQQNEWDHFDNDRINSVKHETGYFPQENERYRVKISPISEKKFPAEVNFKQQKFSLMKGYPKQAHVPEDLYFQGQNQQSLGSQQFLEIQSQREQMKKYNNFTSSKENYLLQINDQIESSHQNRRNYTNKDDSEDTFSNFTPPNEEVKEFFQKQFGSNTNEY